VVDGVAVDGAGAVVGAAVVGADAAVDGAGAVVGAAVDGAGAVVGAAVVGAGGGSTVSVRVSSAAGEVALIRTRHRPPEGKVTAAR
jgi:hypothetical protein